MTLLRLPFSLSLLWAVDVTMTPQPTAQESDHVGKVGLEVLIVPILTKVVLGTLGLAEIIVIIANIFPSTTFATFITSILVHSPQHEIRITAPFFIAWICAIGGAAIRLSCYRAMGQMFTPEVSIRKNHKLVTSGPYSIVRHPGYTAAALVLFGTLLCYTTPGSYFAGSSGISQYSWAKQIIIALYLIPLIITMVALVPRSRTEDSVLKTRFGSDWDEWARRVPYRLIPGVY